MPEIFHRRETVEAIELPQPPAAPDSDVEAELAASSSQEQSSPVDEENIVDFAEVCEPTGADEESSETIVVHEGPKSEKKAAPKPTRTETPEEITEPVSEPATGGGGQPPRDEPPLSSPGEEGDDEPERLKDDNPDEAQVPEQPSIRAPRFMTEDEAQEKPGTHGVQTAADETPQAASHETQNQDSGPTMPAEEATTIPDSLKITFLSETRESEPEPESEAVKEETIAEVKTPDPLNHLPTHELAAAANAEAAEFELPEDWREGRESRTGFAIDKPTTLDVDDAVSLTEDGDTRILHVSIADVGSMLDDQVAISRLARRRLETKYRGDTAVSPMIPKEISENKLSLQHDEDRPALTIHVPISNEGQILPGTTITRDILRARRISYAEAEDMSDEASEEAVALHGLERVARHLFEARHAGEAEMSAILPEDEEGNVLGDSQDFGIGRLIVQESMIAANVAMANFMRENDIPAMYRNHVLPEGLEQLDPAEYTGLARAAYEPTPKGHAALGLEAYTHFTSPLRRFPDFANHRNLAAFLDEQPYPYPEDRLQRIADRMERLALRDRQMQESQPRPPQNPRTHGEVNISPYRRPDYLLGKFKEGTAGPGEIATALFNAVGGNEEVLAVKKAAAEFAAANIHHAAPSLNVAIARGHVTIRPAQKEDGPRKSKVVLEDKDGHTYFYPPYKHPAKLSIACAELIGEICEVPVEPVVPYKQTREGRILENGVGYLQRLADEGRIRLSIQTNRDDDGRAYVGMLVAINKERHTAATILPSRKQAMREVGAELIKRLDLIDNPPPAPEPKPEPAKPKQAPSKAELKASQLANPIVALHGRQGTAELPQPDYSFPDSSEIPETPEGQRVCIVRITDTDGQTYEVTAYGANKKAAKQNAAEAMLAQIPQRPINKKGRMWTGR